VARDRVVIVSQLLFSPWPARPGTRRDSAVDVLRHRFAAGEITEEEHRRRLEPSASSTRDTSAR
jgi:uncharacterized membrane protein